MYPFAEIGGIRLPWAYRGARELCDWVLERPWATGEPVRRLLTAGGAAADLIARWVEELAWRAEKEGGGASVSVVDGAAARPGLDEVLSAELGIARAGDRSAWLSSVADGLAVRPILFLVRFDEVPGPGEAWTEAATDLLADLRKVLGGPTAAVLVLERETGSSRDLDFRCGLPLPDPTWMEDSVQEAWRCYVHMRVAWEAGCRLFELGNEPNHPVEGWGRTHHSAAAYGVKWAAAERRLRAHLPGVSVLFPRPPPDRSFQGAQSFHPFLRESAAAARAAGGRWEAWGLHVYWGHAGGQGQAVEAVRQFCADYPGPDVYVTEFSRQPGTDKANKGQEYKAFVSAQFPVAVKGLFGFVLEASRGWESETWDAAIAQAVGSR